MELTVTVATDGDTTLDFYDMYDAVIQELNTIKVRSTTQLEDEDVEQIGPQGTFGAANRADGPAGTWRLVINEQAGFADLGGFGYGSWGGHAICSSGRYTEITSGDHLGSGDGGLEPVRHYLLRRGACPLWETGLRATGSVRMASTSPVSGNVQVMGRL